VIRVDVALHHRGIVQMGGEIQRHHDGGHLPDIPGALVAHSGLPLDPVVVLRAVAHDVGDNQRGVVVLAVLQRFALDAGRAIVYRDLEAALFQLGDESLEDLRSSGVDAADLALQVVNPEALVGLGPDRQLVQGVLDEGDALIGRMGAHGEVFRTADDLEVLFGLQQRTRFLLLVQVELCLQAQHSPDRVVHALFGNDALLVPIQHEIEVFVDVIEEEEHVAAGRDRAGDIVLAAHRRGHAQHMTGVGDDHAVEAQLLLQQADD